MVKMNIGHAAIYAPTSRSDLAYRASIQQHRFKLKFGGKIIICSMPPSLI